VCGPEQFASVASKTVVTKIIIQEANQVTFAAFTAGTILGLASLSLLVLGSLFLFQKAEQKRYRSNPKYSPEDYIDTTIKYIDDDEECYIYIYYFTLHHSNLLIYDFILHYPPQPTKWA